MQTNQADHRVRPTQERGAYLRDADLPILEAKRFVYLHSDLPSHV
jgi:hypothetical protein